MVCFTLYLAVFSLYLQHAEGFSYKMEKYNFTYSPNDTLEEISANTVLQCARRCSNFDECVAVEQQDDTSTCVILKSMTETTELTYTKQYRMKPVCADGWTRFADSCYTFPEKDDLRANWTNSVSICNGYGAHPLTLSSDEESDFVRELRGGRSIWLGARNRINDNGTLDWEWANGEKYEYTNWEDDNPKNQPNLCARIFLGSNEWRTKSCDYDLYFICEYKIY